METKLKILITGANGFIGRNLVKALKNEYDVTPLTRKEVNLLTKENVDQFFKNKYFDVVIHCAVIGGNRLKQDNDSVIYDNLKMFINLKNHRDKFQKLINFGSGAELYKKNTPYGLSKFLIEQLVQNDVKCYHLRIYNVFGEDELETRFIKANVLRYLKKEPMIIHQDIYMDFVYIDDLINLVKYYINKENPFKIQDICYTQKTTLKEIVDKINKLDQHKVGYMVENPEKGIDYICHAMGMMGNYIDLVGLEEGIRRVYNKLKNEL